ncbi:anti-sigma factor [Herbiconiux sp. CPCC 205763]|uniref:Regulator of SigK n=1 Tax=Herbiconiux aconitum TaxID=2970913 RepID=A0ABT2GQ13_9MICO|nr:anti-sigma factor [Herbiconiux aconitum]MCS5718315.1 anti-sigma factor [Herbiconiux aconitum]
MNDRRDDDDPRLSTGAYSLDALTRDEAEAFERATDASDSLREETDGLVETAGLLGLAATPVAPSERLKTDLMAKLATTPQLDREIPATSIPDASTPAETPVADARHASTTTRAESRASSRARTRWFNRPATLVAGIAAAAALFIGGGVVGTAISGGFGDSVITDVSAAGLAEITAAADSQRSTVPVAGGGTATVVWSNELGRSAVVVDGLATLPDGKVYEAWYIDAAGAAPAGTFEASGDGTSWHVLAGALSPGDTVGVTVEPAGGSSAPTTDPIIVAPTV